VDNLTDAAMLSLKSAMNTPSTIFILTTNYFSKMEMGVKSRCHRVEFNAAPAQAWLPLFRRVLHDLGAIIPQDAALLPIIAGCNGSARDVVTAAAQLANRQKRLAGLSQSVAQSVPQPTLRGTVGDILNGQGGDATP
jgi:DNA polymerase III gamma/tau subunit